MIWPCWSSRKGRLLDESRDALTLKAGAGAPNPASIAPDFSIALDAPHSILASVCRAGNPYLTNDVTHSADYLPLSILPSTCAELALPLRSGQDIFGAMDIQSDMIDTFEAEDITVMQTLADQIAIAIRNAQLYELEKRLRRTEEERAQQLAELNANKDKFFSIVAHDLRGPFQPILSWAYILSRKNAATDPNQVQEIGQKLYRAAKDFAHLLENLLEWARIQQGHILYSPTTFSVHAVAESSIEVLAEMALNKNIHIVCDIDTTLHVHAAMDMTSVVTRNLLSNALKFTPDEGMVMISARSADPPATADASAHAPHFVEISVTDSGIGIAPKAVAQLFRIDVHHTTIGTAQEHGAGLGLTLCKEMIERNGGKIWIESAVGQGTTVTFTLPGERTD